MRAGLIAGAPARFILADMDIVIPLTDESATARLGARLASLLAPGDVVALSGPLGAGKTTLARAAIRALTGVAEAPSPTFGLVETYECARFTLWHLDLYRLEKAEDVFELGFDEALDGVCLIEWAERIERLLPPSALLLRLSIEKYGRRALVRGDKEWSARLAGLNPAEGTSR
jgi:tRNA threonylcarbamoyladenosine biosynthesis protein TsaE